MLFILSPAKALYLAPLSSNQISRQNPNNPWTQPDHLAQAARLVAQLRDYSPAQLAQLMQISDALADLNTQRFHRWHTPFTLDNAKPAAWQFDGDVYEGLDIHSLNANAVQYLQQHLRILSGLYGVLRPMDLMQPYRLEMGTALKHNTGANLYDFWNTTITDTLNACRAKTWINLASTEYFKSIKPKLANATIITPIFEDWHEASQRYKIISFYAKKARGLMVRFAAEQRIEDANKLKNFTLGGYTFAEEVSTTTRWVFRRKAEVSA
jgi:cytoplasmic iron level regulating protein YaaA (DUF328/UPF0246 family)